MILGVIFFGARFVLTAFAGCFAKPGCSNEQWESIYGWGRVLFFLGWASFFMGIFFFVLGIMLATYFAHKSLASEDAPMKQWGQLLKKRGNGVKIIVYKCHEETQKRLRLPIFGGLTGGCHLKNRHGG